MAKKPKKNRPKKGTPFSKATEKLTDVNNESVKFSFKYLADDHSKFNYKTYNSDYFLKLIERLKKVSAMKISEFRQGRSKALRAHAIDWSDTTEKSFGIPGEEQLAAEPYQFALSANKYGRVHGFLIQSKFYIVWLDRKHELYR